MEHNEILEKLKEEYKNINVKEEGVFIMKRSIEQAKKENRNNKIKYVSVACVAALATFVVLPNLSPTIAMAMSDIPVIGKIVDVITINKYDEPENNIKAETPVAKDENNNEALNELNNIFNKIEIGSNVKIVYYKNKQYTEIAGTVTNIDYTKKKIQIDKKQDINISDIIKIEI